MSKRIIVKVENGRWKVENTAIPTTVTIIFRRGTRRCEFESRSRQQVFSCSLQCQINVNLVFISLRMVLK